MVESRRYSIHIRNTQRGHDEEQSQIEWSGIASKDIGAPPEHYQRSSPNQAQNQSWYTDILETGVLAKAGELVVASAHILRIVPAFRYTTCKANRYSVAGDPISRCKAYLATLSRLGQ